MIKLYTTEACVRCPIIKKKLADKNIEFEEINDIEEMTDLGIRAVPMAIIDGELTDFNGIIKWINTK